MNEAQRALLRQQLLLAAKPDLRRGEITDATPGAVEVELGASGDSVPAEVIAGGLVAVGDIVDVLVAGNRPPLVLAGSFAAATGTSLPSSPSDGDVYVYNADTTNGVKWMFQYRSAGASGKKWEFVGGPPIVVSDGDARTLTNQTTFTNLPTDPMSVTLPALGGDYDIEIQADLYSSSNGYAAILSYAVGGSAAADSWAVGESNTPTAIAAAKRTRHTGVASGAAIAEKGRTSGSNSATFLNRRILIWPVRVG